MNSDPDDAARVLGLWDELQAGRRPRREEIAFRSDIPLPQFGQPDPLTVATPAQFVEALRAVRTGRGRRRCAHWRTAAGAA